MDLSLSENQRMIADMIRKFGEEHIKPYIREWDESQHFPVDCMKKLGELGLLGIFVPVEYGGSGFGYAEYVTAISELGKIDPSIALSVAAHNSLCTGHIYYHGSEEQKRKYLPKLASGEWIGAWGLTEPNTGSDAGNMKTTAMRDGDGWVINGAKNFITHGISCDVAVVMTRTGEPNAKNNSTAFIIERGTPGFRGGRKEDKLGMRASETTELLMDDVRIADSQRIGEVGYGFKQAMQILDGGRISIAALALGVAKGAFEASVQYSKERSQFGKSISNFQAIAFKLANMATEIEASELLCLRAADLKDRGQKVTTEGAMAKLFASEACVRISNEAVQIFGGYGFVKDYPVEKFYRDSKLCTIGEGTSEIQLLVISRQLLEI
ncbi:MAG: acyl-CoA dehydrogenase family protein [Bacteroidia bacterium]|nr:acyl-CoA dehydrogenase family protein [Bacteroidota bacterium]MBP6720792.1 acyl-CoA dehydrogenase family protein [Bacteroidia bacterium]